VNLWNAEDGKHIREWESGQLGAESLAFSPNGQILVTGSTDGSLKLWGTNSALLLASIEAHHGAVTAIVFTSDGKTMITSSSDGTVRFWNVIQ
jgi:WD40 repeat protein